MLLVLKLYIKAGPLRWFYLTDSSTCTLKIFLFLITILRTWKLVDGFVSDTEKFSNILANYLNSGTCAQFLNIIACKYTRYLKHLLIFFKKVIIIYNFISPKADWLKSIKYLYNYLNLFHFCYFYRKNLNLCSDLLDTPDFYWDRDDLEKLYLEICRLMQTKYRTKVGDWFLYTCS